MRCGQKTEHSKSMTTVGRRKHGSVKVRDEVLEKSEEKLKSEFKSKYP